METETKSTLKNKFISVRVAKVHNLKSVSVDIPRNKLTVITGVSGSGKSSLAFDTIYAEGQRRFVESLSSYARQFLERMAKPDCHSITGLPPAIAIEQNVFSKNPRSTVGTTTEIFDYLRILFGRIGKTICYNCGKEVRRDTPDSVFEEIIDYSEGDRLYISYYIPEKDFNSETFLSGLKEKGFFRFLRIDNGEIIDIEQADELVKLLPDKVMVLIDRIVLKKDTDSKTRIGDSIELAFNSGDGRIEIRNITKNEIRKFSSNYECANCGILYKEPEPKLFSFNNPYGACPKCQGFGKTIGIDPDLVFPEPSRSIALGGVHPFKGSTLSTHQRDLLKIAKKHKIDIDKPVSMLTDSELKILWEGIDDYIGLNGFFEQLEEQSYKTQYKVLLNRYRGYTKCPSCQGSRLRTSARQVFINGANIPKLVNLSLEDLLAYFKSIKLNEYELNIGGQLLEEIIWRLQLLVDIGLEYLNLSRLSHTLSGGESQRINLSTALGSSLVGTLYVLDEPSIGMHPRDTDRLLKILFKLRNLGNTVIVVEHDPDIIKRSDYVIDMGPMAGEKGGEVIYSGTVDKITESEQSITGAYFSGRKHIDIPDKRNKGNGRYIVVTNAKENNLQIDEVKIPLGCITVITGVSGSGKSTLIHDVVYGGLKKAKGNYQGNVGKFGLITGDVYFDSFELVDQTPIGRSSRSTPATYTKVFDFIRELFAQTQAARQLDWKAGHFSFNVPGGRCDTCEGEGLVTVDMQFLPDVSLVCESCKGSRYKREAMNILYNNKNIVDVLDMTIDEAADFFTETPRIMKKLRTLQDVGLGYLKLGQPSTMLSGGESQRIKLAGHLDSGYDGTTLFIFDEPTTGLHLDDISKLIKCFNQLVNRNHSVIIIEHNLSIIASADWIIDLGPEAGEKGGKLVAVGTPEFIASVENSYTGIALKKYFENELKKPIKNKKK